MAYTIALSTAITTDLVTATITDSTVYTSPIRSAVRVFLTGNKQNFDNTIEEALVLTSDTGDAQTVTSWSWPYQIDGWNNFFFVIIKDAYAGGTTYALYDSVYDSSDDAVYRSKTAGNVGNALSNTTYWELITEPSLLAENKGETNESLNIESTMYQRILTYISQKGYGDVIADASEQCCGDCEDEESDAPYTLLSVLVNGAIIADERSYLPQGETICRRISAILTTC